MWATFRALSFFLFFLIFFFFVSTRPRFDKFKLFSCLLLPSPCIDLPKREAPPLPADCPLLLADGGTLPPRLPLKAYWGLCC